jgi:hypothetical protein
MMSIPGLMQQAADLLKFPRHLVPPRLNDGHATGHRAIRSSLPERSQADSSIRTAEALRSADEDGAVTGYARSSDAE